MLLPNGIADSGAADSGIGVFPDSLQADPNATAMIPLPPYVIRSTTPIPGRWGEPQSISGQRPFRVR